MYPPLILSHYPYLILISSHPSIYSYPFPHPLRPLPLPPSQDAMSKDAEYNDSLDGRERDPQPVDEGDIVRAQEIVDIEAHWFGRG